MCFYIYISDSVSIYIPATAAAAVAASQFTPASATAPFTPAHFYIGDFFMEDNRRGSKPGVVLPFPCRYVYTYI